jgi:hypothetical protein
LSGDPDLERLTNRKAARSDYVESMIDKMLDGKPQTPTEFTDLDTAIPMVMDELQRLLSIGDELDGTAVPVEVINCFVQWLELAKELKAPAVTEPSMAPGVAEASAGMGAPPIPGMSGIPGMGGLDPALAQPDPPLGLTGVAVDPAMAMQFGGANLGGQ